MDTEFSTTVRFRGLKRIFAAMLPKHKVAHANDNIDMILIGYEISTFKNQEDFNLVQQLNCLHSNGKSTVLSYTGHGF